MSNKNPGCLFSLFELFKPIPKNAGLQESYPRDFHVKEESLFVPTYRRKFLLTKNELHFYKELKRVADKLNLTVLSKIRMADLVEPKSTGKDYYREFAKIKAMHVDFALCNPSNLYVVLLIELDDNSHKFTSERDSFVESVYKAAGYKLYRAYGTASLERDISALLQGSDEKNF